MQPWAVPAPQLNAPSRKVLEREMDDPEGNLVIVEWVGHESQQYFADWEYGWDGTAHRFVTALNTVLHTHALAANRRPLEEVGADAGDCAAGEQPADGASDERPDRLQSRFEHSRPVDFKFHVSFLSCQCCF